MDFWRLYTLQAFTPFVLFGILFVYSALIRFYMKKKYPKQLEMRLQADPFEKALSLYLFFLTSLFTLIASIALSPFRCFPQEDGTFTLIPKPSEDCFSKEWNAHLFTIIIAISLLFVIPFLLFILLRNHKGKFNTNKFKWRYGLLTQVYKEKYYYWELCSMFRKTIIVVLVDLLNGFPESFKVFILLMFLISWMIFEAWIDPYRHEGFSTIVSYL
jgi:hypothetical protein